MGAPGGASSPADEAPSSRPGGGAAASPVPASHHDVLEEQYATLATVGLNGRPQLSTVCFLASADGIVRLSVNETRQKAKNMLADPKVSLHIADSAQPARYLELRGHASVQADDEYTFADVLGAKYGGLDLRKMDRPGERRTVVTIVVDRVRAVDMHRPGEIGSALGS
ncbi:MAG: TIGR03618 family F420-dependent PPOX class oxidoreductase [Acidimicrobiia bacterium]|nr:TIGR03618 family F420-dependent PPOX class oxidoreductase [Acidimicrobiia bacterium]